MNASFLLMQLFELDCLDGAASLADTAAVADLGIDQGGNAVDNLKAESGALLSTETAAVADLLVDNRLLTLVFGNELKRLALGILNALVFADYAAGTAVNAAVGVNLMLLLHFAGDCSHRADLIAVIAALASIGNFICHVISPFCRNLLSTGLFQAAIKACAKAGKLLFLEQSAQQGFLFLLIRVDVLADFAVVILNAFVFADAVAFAAVIAECGVDCMLLFHFAGDCFSVANLDAILAALAFIGNFICHNYPP